VEVLLGGGDCVAAAPVVAESFEDACVTGGEGSASRRGDSGVFCVDAGISHARKTRVSTVEATIESCRAIVKKLGRCAGLKTSSTLASGALMRGASTTHEPSKSLPSGGVSSVFAITSAIVDDASARYSSRARSSSPALIGTIERGGAGTFLLSLMP
jgi:hypothetical protein